MHAKELPNNGTRLHCTSYPACIDSEKGPGFKTLEKEITRLEKRNKHKEVFQLLWQLSAWEQKKGMFPVNCHQRSDDKVLEIVDLTEADADDRETVDVDTYIIDVLFKVIKADPDAVLVQATSTVWLPSGDPIEKTHG
jgi:hypothetical protein